MSSSKPKNLNTWEKAKEIRDPLTPEESEMEMIWQDHLESYHRDSFKREDERLANTPLEAMLVYLEFDLYPPPEVLLTVAACFNDYLNHAGEKSLEEVFFGKPIKGKGNYAQRKNKELLPSYMANLLATQPNKEKPDYVIAKIEKSLAELQGKQNTPNLSQDEMEELTRKINVINDLLSSLRATNDSNQKSSPKNQIEKVAQELERLNFSSPDPENLVKQVHRRKKQKLKE